MRCWKGKLAGPTFRHLLVARFNMVPELTRMIHREIEHVKAGRKGRIVLKMNGLHDQNMINELYNASENGVEIDLIVRGICCLVSEPSVQCEYQGYSYSGYVSGTFSHLVLL